MNDPSLRPDLEDELPAIDDCYQATHTLTVDSARQVFHVQTEHGGGNADAASILAMRAGGVAMSLDARCHRVCQLKTALLVRWHRPFHDQKRTALLV